MNTFFKTVYENVRHQRPLIHCITNYVTVNDCANILLAVNASPIMSEDREEFEELYQMVQGICLNIGTLNQSTCTTMAHAIDLAAQYQIPVVLDPVGAGATSIRTHLSLTLLSHGPIALVRGNISEIRALAGLSQKTRGTDADFEEAISEELLEETGVIAKNLAQNLNCIIGISGPTDIIASQDQYCLIRNGHSIMTSISGTGCMLSAVCTAFLGANKETPFEAVAAAFGLMGYCGETAQAQLGAQEGPMAWRTRFMDLIAQLDPLEFQEGIRYEIR